MNRIPHISSLDGDCKHIADMILLRDLVMTNLNGKEMYTCSVMFDDDATKLFYIVCVACTHARTHHGHCPAGHICPRMLCHFHSYRGKVHSILFTPGKGSSDDRLQMTKTMPPD